VRIHFYRNLFTAIMAVALSTGCVRIQRYRSSQNPCTYVPNEKPNACDTDKSHPPQVTATIETHTDFKLGFVEFDDQGWLYGPDGRQQMLAVINALEAESASASAMTLVVFVHGWKHNARADDPGLEAFKSILRRVKTDTPKRDVFGVYVGWRGKTALGPFQDTTLFSRKTSAEHVAKGSVRELFARLNQFQARQQSPENSLVSVVMGHSLGGLIVFNSLSQQLLNEAVDSDQEKDATESPQSYRRVDPNFDLTILINPAFEASRYEALHQVAECRRFRDDQMPVFISMTAKNDTATGFWFHAYRRVATLFEHYYQPKSNETKEKDKKSHKELEEDSNRHTIGYVDRYLTHSLFIKGGSWTLDDTYKDDFTCASVCSNLDNMSNSRPLPNAPIEIVAHDKTLILRHEPRENCDGRNPFWVIKVDKAIINGHGGFDNDYFTDFVVNEINEKVKERERAPHESAGHDQ
jgi:hypothetical protein